MRPQINCIVSIPHSQSVSTSFDRKSFIEHHSPKRQKYSTENTATVHKEGFDRVWRLLGSFLLSLAVKRHFFRRMLHSPGEPQPWMARLVFSRHGCRLKTPRSSPIPFAHSVRKIRLTAQEAEKSRSASTPHQILPLFTASPPSAPSPEYARSVPSRS